MEENQRVSSYKEASEALGKKLIKLYGEKIFPRQGKVFADMLFETGVEAGSYIAALADVEERNSKLKIATTATVKLNQTAYLIAIMKEAGFYQPAHVEEVEQYVEELLKALRGLLASAGAAQSRVEPFSILMPKAAPVQTAPAPQSAPAPAVKPAPAPAPQPKPAAKPAPEPKPSPFSKAKSKPAPARSQEPFDPDGFSDPVE